MDGNINSLNFSINRKQKHPEVEGSLEKVKKKKKFGESSWGDGESAEQ